MCPDRDQTRSLGVSARATVPFNPCHETGFPFVLIGSLSDGLFGVFKFQMLLLLNDCLHCLKGKIDGDCSWAQRGLCSLKQLNIKTDCNWPVKKGPNKRACYFKGTAQPMVYPATKVVTPTCLFCFSFTAARADTAHLFCPCIFGPWSGHLNPFVSVSTECCQCQDHCQCFHTGIHAQLTLEQCRA